MGLTWYLAAGALVIVVGTAFVIWLLLHRAPSGRAQRLLEDRLRFETLLSNLFAKLIHIEASGLDAALEAALRELVTFLGADRGNLDEYRVGALGARISWAKPGVEKLPSILALDHLVWTAETLRRGAVVRFSRTEELPPEAALDRTRYELLGTRSHLSFPLQAGGPMLGVLSFDSVRSERAWPDDLVGRLQLLSEAFASALERKWMELSLGERLRFQRLLSSLSVKLSTVSAVTLDQELRTALRSIIDFLGVERAVLIEFLGPGTRRSWSVDGPTDQARLPWLSLRLQDGEVVRVSRVEDLPAEAATDRRSCLALGLQSLTALPLRAGKTVVGALVLSTAPPGAVWRDEVMEQVHLLGEIVANALERAHAEREVARLRQELAHIGRVSALGELTASLAHELNQPLTAILNNAHVAQQLLEAEVPDVEALRDIVADILADDQRAAKVISRLRALLKKGELDHVLLDLNEIVRDVAELVRSDMVFRHVPMTLDLDPGLPQVRGDRVQLQQVILNLVLNSLEAMSEPDARDHVLGIRTSRAGPTAVSVAIRDSGAGIDMADIDRMFQPLYTTKTEGLGMGLAIARTIVDAHGGELRASNNPEGGATFEFSLPVDANRTRHPGT
ncbi:MAG TPA: ATP-binding protein [Methylomirabilota bacterium]